MVAIEVEQEISKHLMKFWQQIFGYVDGKSRPSLEDHFTAIDLAANTGHHLGPSYSPRKLRAIRRFSIHRAFQILDLKYRQSETIGSLLAELWKGAGFSIISLNWDVVVENHFHALQQAYEVASSELQLNSEVLVSIIAAILSLACAVWTNGVYPNRARSHSDLDLITAKAGGWEQCHPFRTSLTRFAKT